MKKARPKREREVIGWREVIGLPELGIPQMAAKIDTGARTSALHAENQEVFERNGAKWVRFTAPAAKNQRARLIETPVRTMRNIRNTSGVPENRLVIRTLLTLGKHRWHIDVSLADRDAMIFDLIIGRTALKGRRILVDPAHSYLSDLRLSQLTHNAELQYKGALPIERTNR